MTYDSLPQTLNNYRLRPSTRSQQPMSERDVQCVRGARERADIERLWLRHAYSNLLSKHIRQVLSLLNSQRGEQRVRAPGYVTVSIEQ